MADRTARDIMTSPVISVRPDTGVREVAHVLSENEISGVPVVSDDGKVVGMVTEADLMVKVAGPHLPAHIELLGGVIYLENPLEMSHELRKAMAVTAEQIMSRDVITVEADTPVRAVAELMMKKRLNRVAVVEKGGIAGIVTRHDVIETLIGEGDEEP